MLAVLFLLTTIASASEATASSTSVATDGGQAEATSEAVANNGGYASATSEAVAHGCKAVANADSEAIAFGGKAIADAYAKDIACRHHRHFPYICVQMEGIKCEPLIE